MYHRERQDFANIDHFVENVEHEFSCVITVERGAMGITDFVVSVYFLEVAPFIKMSSQRCINYL